MSKKLAIIFLVLLFFISVPLPSLAERVLKRIERTGIINAGSRQESIPFGYVGINNEWMGYSLDLLQVIRLRLERQLNKPIKLNLQKVTVDNRFELVQQGTLDIVCGATTITRQRLQKVDFSVPFFMTGTQFLVRKDNQLGFKLNSRLENVPIAYIPGTTTDEIIRQIYPQAKWIAVSNRPEGVQKLQMRQVQAFASDGILLVGELVRQGNSPKNFDILPSQPMTTELYGCILPKNNPQWKEFVDDTINSSENTKLQNLWFDPETGRFPYLFQLTR